MSSTRQIVANQRNAQKSTGPRSPEGKTRSRRNALKHGLTARQAFLPDEDPAKFDALREAIFARFEPDDALKVQLVERIVWLLWRLQRIPAFEVDLFKWMRRSQKMEDAREFDFIDEALFDDFGDEEDHDSDEARVHEVGRTIEALLNNDLISKLGRYETTLQRQFSATLKELADLELTGSGQSKLMDLSTT